MRDGLITFLVCYLYAGALVWMLLDALGIIRASKHSAPALVLASVYLIVAWPRFAYVWAMGMRKRTRSVR